MANDFWTSEKIERLIELWETKPCLYDTTKTSYHDRNAKKRAREEIAQALNTEENETMSKLKNMKSQFSRERAKAMKLKSGSGTEEVPVSKWIYLASLKFLIPFANAKPSKSNLELVINSQLVNDENDTDCMDGIGSDSESIAGSEHSFSSLEEPKSTKRPTNTPRMAGSKQKRDACELDILKKSAACMERAMSRPAILPTPTQDDSLLVFGKYIASELREMTPEQMRRSKLRIQQVIIDAQSQIAFQPSGSNQQPIYAHSSMPNHGWFPGHTEATTTQLEYHQL